ncbi:MAG: histidine phosphatase family protein [Bacteroidia bacterium]|nr:histidine phosphatase family protein [Bacteroidia bacterium]
MKKIYIIRHGETDFNRMNIVQGNGVDTDLNETGLNQGFLFYNKYKNISFDKIYVSGLTRTQQTIQHFINDGIPYEKLHELNEISWGEYEGKAQDFKEREFYQYAVNAWNSGNYDVAVANGETPNQLQERQKKALEFILKNTHEKTVLVCMHGRALKSFICLLLNVPLLNMDNYQHQNTCLYQLDFDGEKFELITQNDVSHLGD